MADESNSNNPKSDPVNPVPKQEDAKTPYNEPATGIGSSVGAVDADEEKRRAAEAEEQRRQRWKTAREWATTGASIIALIVSLKACDNTQRSASASEQSAIAAKQSAVAAQENVATAKAALEATIKRDQRDQRAWVGIERIMLLEERFSEGKVAFTINIRNSGKTPGLRATPRIRYSLTPLKDLHDFDFLPPASMSSVYAPGIESHQTVFFLPEEYFDKAKVEFIKAGELPVYIFGVIDYEDAFGEKHFTRFCFRYPYDESHPSLTLRGCPEKDYNHME